MLVSGGGVQSWMYAGIGPSWALGEQLVNCGNFFGLLGYWLGDGKQGQFRGTTVSIVGVLVSSYVFTWSVELDSPNKRG